MSGPGRSRPSARSFFTNWTGYEGPLLTKIRLTLRNRYRAMILLKGCCGHEGEPGCCERSDGESCDLDQ